MKNGMGFTFQPTFTRPGPDGTRVKGISSIWWICYSVRGVRHRESSHSTDEKDARRLLKARNGDVAAGRPVGNAVEKTRLCDLTAMVIDDYKANGRRSTDRVRQAIAHLHDFFRPDCRARDISADRVTKYQSERLEEGAQPSTVNYEIAMLRRAFRLGTRAGKVAVRPEFPMLAVSNARVGFFEAPAYHAVLRHLPDYLRPVATAAYITGWRTKSELLTRQWRHVDLSNGWLRLDPGEGKTKQGRNFPLTPELRALLEAQRARVREIERATGTIIPWVFVHPMGEGRAAAGSRVKDFRGAWAKACRAAGVPGALVHDLRRTAVRNLERAGVPRSAAMAMTGHKTEAVYRRYAIVDSSMLQEAAAKLSALHVAEGSGR